MSINEIHEYNNWTMFKKYVTGRNMIRIAYFIFNVFFVWKIIVAYNSVFLAGMVPVLSLLGYLLILIPEGHILDRFNRGSVFRISAALLALTYIILFFYQSLIAIYTVALISSVLSSINSDAFNTTMKEIVSNEKLQSAVSLSQGTNAVSELAGIILGGILLYFPLSYLSIILFALPVICIITGTGKTMNRAGTADPYGFKGAMKIVVSIMPFLLLTLLLNGLFISLDVFGSGLIHIILHGSPMDYSLFVGAFPAGVIIGSIFAEKISGHLSKTRFISSLLVPLGLILLVISLSKYLYVDIIMAVLLGVTVIWVNIGFQTIFMKAIPDSVMGRVNSIGTIFSLGGSPLMAAIFSILSNYFYFPYIMSVAALIAIAVAIPSNSIIKSMPDRISKIVGDMESNQNIPMPEVA